MANWQIPGFLDEIDSHLHIDGVDVIPLAESFGTPLFIFSEDRIRHNCAEIQTAFQQWQFKTQVFYASKANSNLSILHVIRDAGMDIEVNSGGELYKALKVGFSPDQIIFNGVAKTEQEIREAISSAVFCINVDSLYELSRVAEIAAALNVRANIALRMVPDVEAGSHGGLETGTHASKFGISQNELLGAYQQVINDPIHLNLIGLHIHIGAQTIETSKFAAGFETLLRFAAECFAYSGKPFSTLNIGGGLPVTFIKPGDKIVSAQIINDPDHPLGDLVSVLQAGPSPADVARETIGRLAAGQFDQQLDQIAPGFRKSLENTRILLEPGSRVVADTAVLLTTIHNYKIRPHGVGHWLLLDAGFNTLLDTFSYNWYYHLGSANRAADPHKTFYRLGGPLCDSGDIYHDSERLGRLPDLYALPENLVPGDLLMFLDVGAYTLEQMCQYNGQRRAAALLIRSGGDVRLIRRRDSYSDLVEQDIEIFLDSNNPDIEQVG